MPNKSLDDVGFRRILARNITLPLAAGVVSAGVFVVLLVIGYHHSCAVLLRKLADNTCHKSHRWFRFYNEVPVLLLVAAVILVVVKPF